MEALRQARGEIDALRREIYGKKNSVWGSAELLEERGKARTRATEAQRARNGAVEAQAQAEADIRAVTVAYDTAVVRGDMMEGARETARAEREVQRRRGMPW